MRQGARCIVADARRVGESLWDRFTASKEEIAWYYTEVARICRARGVSVFLGGPLMEAALEIARLAAP